MDGDTDQAFALRLGYLRLKPNDVLWDIGTGTLAIKAALMISNDRVVVAAARRRWGSATVIALASPLWKNYSGQCPQRSGRAASPADGIFVKSGRNLKDLWLAP